MWGSSQDFRFVPPLACRSATLLSLLWRGPLLAHFVQAFVHTVYVTREIVQRLP
jgi:hypothetical protein